MALDDVDVKQAELFEDFEIDSKLAAKIIQNKIESASSTHVQKEVVEVGCNDEEGSKKAEQKKKHNA